MAQVGVLQWSWHAALFGEAFVSHIGELPMQVIESDGWSDATTHETDVLSDYVGTLNTTYFG